MTKKNFIASVANRLKDARKDGGYRFADQFSREIGVNKNTYRTHEKGTQEATINDLAKYAMHLSISLSWLIYGVGSISRGISPLDNLTPELIQPNTNIGDRLKIARTAFGWKTRDEFSRAVGIPKNTIRLHEMGERPIRPFTFLKYNEQLHISYFWLLSGFGRPVEFSCEKIDGSNENFVKKMALYERIIESTYEFKKIEIAT